MRRWRARLVDLTMNLHPRFLLLILLSPLAAFAGEPEFFDVFVPATDGFKSIRIPSVVVTNKGKILAFAEGRAANADQAQNKILLKVGTDGGRTWGPAKVLESDGANSLNNPCVVVDLQTGRVILMYQRIPGHLTERSNQTAPGYEGPDVYRNFVTTSDDDGATWTVPADVTRTTKRPAGATTICGGPGIGIQLTCGLHKGRLIIPFNEGPYGKWNNFAVFSDDRGTTWACGENVPDAMVGSRSQINEVQMVELSDGSVMLNSRQFAGAKVRKTAVSHDGGISWSPIEDAPELVDPSCMASIFRYNFPDAGEKSQILFSGPDDTKRANGTIRLSYDEGKTWPVKRVIRVGSFGYSVLTRLPDGMIGCLFESEGNIVFGRFSLDWLTENQPTR